MAPPALPAGVADEMVEILFRETPPFEFKDLLLVGTHIGELDTAIDRYVSSETGSRPTVHIASSFGSNFDPETIEGAAIDGQFLSEAFTPEQTFDYILGTPPDIPWDELDPERRREIAGFSPHVDSEQSHVESGVVYLDRIGPLLAHEGRAAILAETQLKIGEEYAGFRSDIIEEVRDVEAVDPQYEQFENPWFVLALENGGSTPHTIDDRAQWADPTEIEQQLATTATNSREQLTAEDIMTPLSEMEVYTSGNDAPMVYLDMLYEDYDGSLVYEEDSTNGNLVGYVARHELTFEGTPPIERHTEPLTVDRCIPPDAPIDMIVRQLTDQRFLFPGQPESPDGIITRYDLNRLPIYHWLYDRFARLEIQLRELIRGSHWTYEESDISLRNRGAGDLVPDRLANDKLSKLVDIIDEADLERSVLSDIELYEATLDDLVKLRNAVAHYNVLIHTMSNQSTVDNEERGTTQFYQELTLLLDIIQ
jgi:hypothetical protein